MKFCINLHHFRDFKLLTMNITDMAAVRISRVEATLAPLTVGS
jgi:hypothetical protein